MMRFAFGVAGLTLLLLLTACGSGTKVKSNEIVDTIPWTAPETTKYRVLDNDDKERGTLEMTVEEDGDTYVLRQHFEFPDDDFVNESEVVVDATTLMPQTVHYEIDGPEGLISCEGAYDGGVVHVHNVRTDGEKDDDLDVPNFRYDSWSDLFVWRTIRFSQSYDIEYADVVACQAPAGPQLLGTKIEVKGGETVEVPAGTFDTWKVEIKAGRDQKAWFTTDDSHTLVKYDNGVDVFELVEGP